ncbi:hypothetical protein [Pseudomonas brenneri]|uniref:hypothetical protein n=1 Tax=Pseudomonas brenneri TaxID=129817 RepID=UPI003B9DCB1A
MKAIAIAALLFLTGCASKVVEYQPAPITAEQARSVIEQVLMEQPEKTRPEQVFFTNEYIAYGSGVVSSSSGFASAVPIGNGAIAAGNSVTSSKSVQTRIYFNSIGTATLYTKRNRWVVITRNRAGGTLNFSRVDTQQKAQRFIDAMMYFKAK